MIDVDPRSEVLLRQADRFTGRLLLAGLPADDLLGHLPDAQGWSWHAGDQAALTARFGPRVEFGTAPPAVDIESAVLFVPKSRELTDYLVASLASRLAGRSLFLVGEKRGGVERAAKQAGALGPLRKLDSARHCQLWEIAVTEAPATPDLEALAQRLDLDTPAGSLEIVTLPGVFSHGRLDRGTALLLEHLDRLPTGRILDFGCGAGVIGAVLKRLYPHCALSMLDVDAFALHSTRLTLQANGLEADLLAADGIEHAHRELAAIVSNPPFHQGVHTDYRPSEALLRQAPRHLAASGELRIVANSFLKYPPLLQDAFGQCQTLAEQDGFRIYRAWRG